MIGATLGGRYRIVHLLGEGGMGAVYEAERVDTGDRVAVKILDGRRFGHDDRRARRFRREARAAGALQSPHIVEVHDAGVDGATGAHYLVMERLHGEDLRRLVERVGPLPPDVALRIAAQALAGLSRAHEAGVIHRDIKPANLFLARREGGEIRVVILDFGLAKVASGALFASAATELTRTGDAFGSVDFMSPEQAQDSKAVDPRADLWSLGAVLHHTLTGRAPHAHVTHLRALIIAICATPVAPIRLRAPWVPPDVAAVIHGALEIDPARRPASAAAMLDAIRPLVSGDFALHEDALTGLGEPALAVSGDASTLLDPVTRES